MSHGKENQKLEEQAKVQMLDELAWDKAQDLLVSATQGENPEQIGDQVFVSERVGVHLLGQIVFNNCLIIKDGRIDNLDTTKLNDLLNALKEEIKAIAMNMIEHKGQLVLKAGEDENLG